MPGRNVGADAHQEDGRPAAPRPGPGDPCDRCGARADREAERLAAALRASESRFRAAFSDAGIGMALIDRDDLVIEGNPVFAAMLGRAVAELPGMHIHQIIDPEEPSRRRYRELVRGERDRMRAEKRLKHRGGREVWGRVTVSLVRDHAA